MKRRQLLLHGTRALLLASPLAALLSACARHARDTGPEPVRLGRDVCTRCQMVLSDVRFVAEVRGGPDAALRKFDDVGCAVTWLAGQAWGADPAVRIWVASLASRGESPEWLDARRAVYRPGHRSPMGYDYGAVAATAAAAPPTAMGAADAGDVDFATLQHAALARGY